MLYHFFMTGTPFHFTGNTSVLNSTANTKSTTKQVFDLKASLAKPMTWKPHTGKLKPINQNYVPPVSASKPAIVTSRVDVFKSAVQDKVKKTYSR